jgi:hypothetical protein
MHAYTHTQQSMEFCRLTIYNLHAHTHTHTTVDGVLQAYDEIIMVGGELLGEDENALAQLRGDDLIGAPCELVVKRCVRLYYVYVCVSVCLSVSTCNYEVTIR